jgi:hypothetical protein
MLSGHCPSWTCYFSQATGQVTQGSCKVREHSILSLSKDAAQATRLRKPASFDKLRMLVSGLSSYYARALTSHLIEDEYSDERTAGCWIRLPCWAC